jgi:hypothetical protein
LLITLTLGVLLAFGLGGTLPLWRPGLTNLHLTWGLFGWIAILIAAVAWQVVPMFQITPPYPARLRLKAARLLMLLLLGKSLLFWPLSGRFAGAIGLALDVTIAAGLVAFALATLRLQSRARRKVRDSHRDFWRLGMAHLLLATALWLAGTITGSESLQLFAATAFLLGFAVSVITGMLLKIIAFLLWLHLQSLRDALLQSGKEAFSVPKMKAVIPARHADRLLFMLMAAQLAIGFAIALPGYGSIPAALLWLLHFGYLGVMASHALYRYHRIRVRVTPHVGAIRPPGTRARLDP